MPAGRPKIRRTQEDAKAAQRLSKRLYARRIRSQQASIAPSPPKSNKSQAETPSPSLSITPFESPTNGALTPQPWEQTSRPDQGVIPWLGDLELLHHFTTRTCYELSDKFPSQQIWQTTIPQIAYSYPFLMRGLLALSALHLAHVRPQEANHFEIKAMAHQNAALGPFQDAMKDISPTNCHALFAFSATLVVIGFASPHSSSSRSLLDVREKTTRWMRLVRGVYPMLSPMWNHLIQGGLRGMLTAGVVKSAAADSPTEPCFHYSALSQLLSYDFEDPETREACAGALEELRICFICTDISLKNRATSEVATIMAWSYRVPQGYLAALEQGNPIAMIILAYYTIALQHIDRYWWINGEPARMLLSVYRLLDKSMRAWLDWPLQVLNLELEAKSIA